MNGIEPSMATPGTMKRARGLVLASRSASQPPRLMPEIDGHDRHGARASGRPGSSGMFLAM